MTTMDYGRPASFRIGRVIGDSFGVFGRNFLVCIGLALIFSGLPTVLYQWWILGAVGSAYDPAMPETASMSAALLPIIGALISFALGAILQAGLTRAAIEDLNGEKPTFGDCLSTALAVLLPALGIAILTTLGISIGFMLLIVPGVILLLRWAVSIPVLVNERLGVLGSMSRSAELTKGNRWQLLGLYVILLIIIIGLQLVLGVALGLLASMLGTLGALIALGLISSISTIAMSIIAAVAYVELRFVKEGADVKDLAEIFA